MKCVIFRNPASEPIAVMIDDNKQMGIRFIYKYEDFEYLIKYAMKEEHLKKEPADDWFRKNSELFRDATTESFDLDMETFDKWLQMLGKLRCPNCNRVVDKSDNYCGGCGKRIEIKKKGLNDGQTSNIKVPLHVNCRAFAEAVNNVIKKPGTEDDNLLLKMSEPIQKWLRQNKNPYVKVVIGDSGVEVISTEQWIPYKD